MAPLCFARGYFAQEIFTRFPGLIYPLVVIGILYAMYVVRILRRLVRPKPTPAVPMG